MLRSVLERIRSFTTDLGTEFLVRDVGDFLIPFMRCIGARVPVAARQHRFLFPFALAAAGWHHIMDALLRFGLLTQNWFGGFLDLVKALTKWLRVATDDIMDTLNTAGKSGAAALVGALTLKNFAQWRWKTLESVMRSLKSCVVALRLHKDCLLPLLDRSKDTVWAAQVRKGLMEPKFMMRFEFVDWFASWVTRLERWGSSCPCVDHQGLCGVQCDRRGRLLHLAHGHACQEFADALAEVHSWEPERFDMDLVLLQELECCVRATVARGKEKLAFLDRLPYLLCRLDSGASVAQRALDQFGEVPEQHHHRLSVFFLGQDSMFRKDIETLAAGGALAPALKHQILCLQDIPLDDSVGESPHASAHRQLLHSRSGRFGYHCASQRLVQNFRDLEYLKPTFGSFRAVVAGQLFVRSEHAREQAFEDFATSS